MSGTCMRCPYGRPRDAEYLRQFTISEAPESVYVLRLCAEHARRFDCDLNIWVNLADEVEGTPPTIRGIRPTVSRKIGDDAAARIRELRERAAERARPVADSSTTEGEVVMGPRSDEWRFTVHAQKRAEERGYTLQQAYEAAANPTLRKPADEGCEFRANGECCVVVDVTKKLIVTVHDKFTNVLMMADVRQKEVV